MNKRQVNPLISADSNASALALGAHFVISPDLDEDIMLPTMDSEKLYVVNKQQAAVKLPLHSVVFKEFLEVITQTVAKLSSG